ncbi:TetR/AcrR family acrAB operon transcriptional repressor [Saccharothrix ecbatanensis]|uniref:TetR/AcrR family acrAB operon transcriptional repressor n=1 Tax=Saccharothrix ecbatanensis TaxID=1105145 RepID=A0A7W9HDP2_9PSEU|nr:TetR/AcrR family transcriptional regulator [Saccharothrix ecbatanensis]MBB5800362.1 TetR/AcrR family acrAB operon transcriptional repressor [Saccharothrix ecbatanensis]
MTTSRATRRAETTQESRRLLIAAATDLFAERGYRQTTFEDIAARSGVSRGSIPWHFGNKEGLLAAVVEQVVEQLRVDADALEPGSVDQALDRLVEFTRSPSTRLFVTLLAEAVEPDSPPHKRYGDLHRALRDQVRAKVEEVDLPDGVGAEELSTVLLGAIMGIHLQWRIAPDAVDLERTYSTVGALLRSVMPFGS